jgi:hypothetical protein
MTFFNKPSQQGPEVKTDKADKIKQLKDFFPEADSVFKKAFTAVMGFKQLTVANKSSSEEAAQLFNKDIEKDCQKNFSAVSLTLEEDYLYDEDLQDGFLEELHKDLKKIKSDLTALKHADGDKDRQNHYEAAIVLVDKIDAICSTIQPPQNGPRM